MSLEYKAMTAFKLYIRDKGRNKMIGKKKIGYLFTQSLNGILINEVEISR